MPDAQQLLLFLAAGVLLNLTPGPDVLYIVRTALRSGARAGVVAALGINAGCFVHILAAALGVGALLATSAMAFTALKWAGAAWLVWTGARLLLGGGAMKRWGSPAGSPPAYERRAHQEPTRKQPSPDQASPDQASPDQASPDQATTLWNVFRGGFLTNVLNPKVAIFFLAFVPQFIAPETQDKPLAFVLLGALFVANSVVVNAGWALAAARIATAGRVRRAARWLDRAAGAMFLGFGLKLALSDHPAH